VVAVFLIPPAVYRPADQADARASLQSGLLTVAAALLAVAGGLVALAETRRSNANTHVRELYVEAVKLLNDDNLGIRLGGIYALERIAVDSPPDQRIVVEVLSAFVRTRSTDTALRTPPATDTTRPPPARPAADIRAAIQVLGRLPQQPGVPRADLTGADLTGPASLAELNLARADLSGVDLSGAALAQAWLAMADLTGTDLHNADLTRAQLSRTTLAYTRLENTTLTDTLLGWADLANARFLSQGQVDTAHGNEGTLLPPGLVRPASWSPAPPAGS
jgi:hypothetical protein